MCLHLFKGAPLQEAAALARLPAQAFLNYLDKALTGGGYYSNEAAAIYRIRNGPMEPNFIFLALQNGEVVPANFVVVHFHLEKRVSKNLKELSYNCRLAPGVGDHVYVSLKDMINAQFLANDSPAPLSSTVTSAGRLQRS